MTGLNLNSKIFITVILPPITSRKTVNGVTTNYYLNGTQIIAEETNGNITEYLYNSTGVIGFRYRASTYAADKWDLYFFEKNLQGDIVAVYNTAGLKLLSYTYDAWGNVTTTRVSLPPIPVLNNPFTYRGYYYDKDLGLYYLNSRYYDSQTGRFISADVFETVTAIPNALTDKNLYAYCDNNPVMFTDYTGEFPWHILIGSTIGGIIGGASAALSGGDIVDVIVGVISGAFSGSLAASGISKSGQIIGSSLISMASNAIIQFKNIINNDANEPQFDIGDMLFDGAVSAVTAYWGGNGASHGNTAGINSSWNQLFKRGMSNQNARKYFYKTAHNSDGIFVLSSLIKSLYKSAVGSGVIVGKNYIKGKLG